VLVRVLPECRQPDRRQQRRQALVRTARAQHGNRLVHERERLLDARNRNRDLAEGRAASPVRRAWRSASSASVRPCS
jgi:hypothetical protein